MSGTNTLVAVSDAKHRALNCKKESLDSDFWLHHFVEVWFIDNSYAVSLVDQLARRIRVFLMRHFFLFNNGIFYHV